MSADALADEANNPTALAQGLLGALQALTAGADATTAPGWVWSERSHVISVLDRAVELLSLYRSRVLLAHRNDGRWAGSGDRSFEDHRGRTSREGRGTATAEMRFADGLAQMPEAVRAVEEGRVGLAHARVLTRLRAQASDAVRTALDEGGTGELLRLAEGLEAPTFARRAAAWVAACDTEAAERSFEAVRQRRYVRAVDRDGGTKIDGFVDPVVGARFRSALEALTPVPSADDVRTTEQRAADALATMASRVLDQGSDKIGAQVRPHLSVIVPADTWVATRARRVRRTDRQADGDATGPEDVGSDRPGRGASSAEVGASNGEVGASSTGVDTSSTGVGADGRGRSTVLPELDDGTVIPLSQLDLLACDCELTRMVLDAEGTPLDVGQTERTYGKELRRAVLVRDGHCRWPGCTMRSAWCEVHHIRWFSHGGPTSLENGISLCVFHHHEVHRRTVTIRPTRRGHVFLRRDGSEIGRSDRQTGIVRMLTPMRADEPSRRPATVGCDGRPRHRMEVVASIGRPPGLAERSPGLAGRSPGLAECSPGLAGRSAGLAAQPPPGLAGSPTGEPTARTGGREPTREGRSRANAANVPARGPDPRSPGLRAAPRRPGPPRSVSDRHRSGLDPPGRAGG